MKPKPKPPAGELKAPPQFDVDRESIRREARFVEIGKVEGGAKEERLRNLFEKWRQAKTGFKTSEEEEILNYKIILPMAVTSAAAVSAPAENDTCYSQKQLGKRMRQHYLAPDGANKLKISIDEKVINAWIRLERDTHVPPPPGPMAGTKTRYSFKAWTDWFDKYLLAEKLIGSNIAARDAAAGDEEDLTVMEQQDRKDAIRQRKWKWAKERGEYVHHSIALATGIAAVKKLHLMVKQEDERAHTKLRREKLLELSVSLDLVEKFSAWDKDVMRQATDRREAAMDAAGMTIEFPKEADAT